MNGTMSHPRYPGFDTINGKLLLIALCFFALVLFAPRPSAAQEPAGPLPPAAPSPSDRPVIDDAPAETGPASASTPMKSRGPAKIGGNPNISGTWELNKDQSDDPNEKMQQGRGSSGQNDPNSGGGWGHNGGVWGPGGGNGGGLGYPTGGRGGSSQTQDTSGATNNLSELTIKQTARITQVSNDAGDLIADYQAPASDSSAKSSDNSSSNSDSSSTKSSDNSSKSSSKQKPPVRWEDDEFIAVEQGRNNNKITRTFELSSDGTQLYLTTKIENPRYKQPVTIHYVYDPAPAGE